MSAAELQRALFLSAAFGGGHREATRALEQALQQVRPDTVTAQADVVALLEPHERTLIAGTYALWLRHTPEAYRAFYNWTDSPREPRVITSSFGWLGRRGLTRTVLSTQPQLVVGTFPILPALAHAVQRRQGLRFLNALVLTDYRVHHHWARPEADLICVPNEHARAEMLAWGIDDARLEVTGLPIAAEFARLAELGKEARCAEMREALGWPSTHSAAKPARPLVVVSGGSGMYRAYGAVVQALGRLGTELDVLVLAGPGPTPRREQVGGATVHHLGFRRDFPRLLAGADLLVGKAGGLTVAECTALGVPMVVYQPIPGQEEHNAHFVVGSGAGLWARSEAELRLALSRALEPCHNAALSRHSAALGKPHAAEQTVAALLRHWHAGEWQ